MSFFRFPERLGAFSIWIAPEVYPLAERARAAGEAHRALLRERLRQTMPGGARPDLSADEEFLVSATSLFRRLEELWEGLESRQAASFASAAPQVRRLFLASAVEWALDLHYEVRAVRRVAEGEEARWQVTGRAWDGERPYDYETTSIAFEAGDERSAELTLVDALGRAFTGAIGGLIGWTALDSEVEAREADAPATAPPPERG